MASELTIGELAAAANVPTSTVRYYERAGLLPPAGRTSSNYRLYDEDSVGRLRFIRSAQASGFALGDIATLLDLSDQPRGTCERVRQLIEARLTQVCRRLKDLQRTERVLKSALRWCHKGDVRKTCAVLDRLKAEDPPPDS